MAKIKGVRAIPAERYKHLLDRLGLTQRAASRFMGINERTSRSYASGEYPVDPRTAMLLEIMVKHKIAPEQALRLIGVDTKAAAEAAEVAGPQVAPRYFVNRRGTRQPLRRESKDGP